MSTPAPLVPTSKSTGTSAVNAPPVFGTTRGDFLAMAMLGAVAGYVDAAGFLGLFGLFTAHVTGELVAAGTTLANGFHAGLSVRLAPIMAFMISVVAATLVTRATRRRGYRPIIALLALLALSLTVFCATGVVLQSRLHSPDEWAVVLTGAVGVFSMGLQNALMRDVLYSFGPTTLMTGNLAQLTMDLVELVLPEEERGPEGRGAAHRIETRRRLVRSAASVSAFLLGTVLGGVAITLFGFWSIALPAAVIGMLTVSVCLPWRARRENTTRALVLDRWMRRFHVDPTAFRSQS